MNPPSPSCSLENILVAPLPGSLEETAGILEAETAAFAALSDVLASVPAASLQALAELAMRVTRSDSAGISLESAAPEGTVFRWVATAGELAPYVNGTMPRHDSPCGATVEAGKSLVMREPGRHYAYLGAFRLPVRTLLLVPFARAGKFVGTVWVLQHHSDRIFNVHDVRAVENLSGFVCEVLDGSDGAPHH